MSADRRRAAYAAQMEGLARDAFAEHTGATKAAGARERGLDGGALGWHAGRVCIRRPGTSVYAVEVVWLRFGRLLVHGDLPPVIIAAPDSDFREAVRRLATSHIDYIADKVTEARGEDGRTVDRDVLVSDLLEHRREEVEVFEEAGGRGVSTAERIDALDEAIEASEGGTDPYLVRLGLYRRGVDPEILLGLGRVVAVPVWYAHAALRRVDEIHGWRCPECDGRGWCTYELRHATTNEPCDTCSGTGTVNERPGRRAS